MSAAPHSPRPQTTTRDAVNTRLQLFSQETFPLFLPLFQALPPDVLLLYSRINGSDLAAPSHVHCSTAFFADVKGVVGVWWHRKARCRGNVSRCPDAG